MSRPVRENSDESSPESGPPSPGSESIDNSSAAYEKIARNVTGWTSNLLATAMVLIIALVGGRELVTWWRADDSEVASTAALSPAASWAAPEDSYVLEFGDAPFRFRRDLVVGERKAAIDQIKLRCLEMLKQRPTPLDEVGPAEATLLKNISETEPLVQSLGKWRIFESSESMPMLVGIRDDCEGASVSRMVVWGMAIPQAENQWHTYTCCTTPGGRKTNSDPVPIPLPQGASQNLSITGVDGGRIVGFTGGDPQQIVMFYDRVAVEQGWHPSGVWRRAGNQWSAEFTRDTPSLIRMEIQLTFDSQRTDHATRGLITMTPGSMQEETD